MKALTRSQVRKNHAFLETTRRGWMVARYSNHPAVFIYTVFDRDNRLRALKVNVWHKGDIEYDYVDKRHEFLALARKSKHYDRMVEDFAPLFTDDINESTAKEETDDIKKAG